MTHFRSNIIWIVACLAIIGGLGAKKYIDNRYEPLPVDFPVPNTTINPAPTSTPPLGNGSTPSNTTTPSTVIPPTLLLSVPFTIQSPDSKWEGIYKEACEEASVLMAAEYFKGNTAATLGIDFAMQEIQNLANWEQQRFGYNLDINNEEAREMAEDYYGLKTAIVHNFTADDIKKALAEGKLVLLPADGRLLGNPNFRRPGPPYHMLVIKGYNSQGFVTNDPGTRNGRNYAYSFETLYNATGEWDHSKDAVDTSIKEIILVWE